MVRAFSSYLVFLELPAPYFLKHKLPTCASEEILKIIAYVASHFRWC